jgi:hypothetical protein
MKTTIWLGVVGLLFGSAAMNAGSRPASAWSGVIIYSSCGADEAFAESPECLKKVPGAKLSLYDDTNRVVYSLEPQERVTRPVGEIVTVRGTLLEGDTIRVGSVAPLTVGIAPGQKAPAFSAPDQFGRMQSLESLKGRNGTALLFFRSADW